jgi:thiamine pyrophosphate-dependent acetolactate synthase large subunit-like protein
MGDANQDLIVNLGEKHGVKFVHAHHEGSAVSMADGYARFSHDKMGLASVTQGPGYTNATTFLVARFTVGRACCSARWPNASASCESRVDAVP